MRNLLIPVLLLTVVTLIGCSKKDDEQIASSEPTKPKVVATATQVAERAPLDEDLIVARFAGDGMIKLGAILKFTRDKERNVLPIRPGDTEISLIKDLRRRTLDQVLEEELIYRRAKQDGIALPEASLESMVSEMVQKKYNGSEEALNKALEDQGMSLDMLKQAMERQFLVTEYIKRKVQQEIHVGDEELEPFYNEHIDDFTTPNVYDVHFLEIKATGSSPKELEEAKQKIESLRAEIVSQIDQNEGMEDKLNKVIAFCREHSQDENKMGGSWWKVFGHEGNIEPALEDAAEEAPIGEFGSIFELQRTPGYVTAYKRSMTPSIVKPFDDEAKDTIRRLLYKERRDKLFEEVRADLKEGADITIYEDALYSGLEQN